MVVEKKIKKTTNDKSGEWKKPAKNKTARAPPTNGKTEEKDYSFDALCKSEYEENSFSRYFYRKKNGKFVQANHFREKAEGMTMAHYELNAYKHQDAINFAATTWLWRNSFYSKNNRKSLSEAPKDLMVPNKLGCNRDIRAYYRVVGEQDNKYILMACHINLHGFHRGDLRFVEVNDRTVTKGFEQFSVIGKLFLGDIVAVTKLCKISKEPLDPPKALKMHQDSQLIWEVAEMTVLKREIDNSIKFAFMKNGSAIVKGHNEAMSVLFDEKCSVNLESIYCGSAFVPAVLSSKFTDDYNRRKRLEMIKQSSYFISCPNALGTIFKYTYSEDLTTKFKAGREAFKSGSLYSTEQEDIVELCTQMGQSAVMTLFDGRSDSRTFPIQNAHKDKNVVRFYITNPYKYPTEGLWNCNNRIRFEGFAGSFDGTIETVIHNEKSRLLQITARVSRNASERINFKYGTYVVYQREPNDTRILGDGFFRYMGCSENGKRIIQTLYGGPSLQNESKRLCYSGSSEKYTFPSDPPVELNEYQNEYVSMITSSNFPMVLASSPFGCGKSMTIVMAAIEKCKFSSSSQQFLITQSNYASVNLIDIARKVKDSDMKILRYVTVDNWKELPEQCRTEYDLPVLMELTFRQWAQGELHHEFEYEDKGLILYYLEKQKKLFTDLLTENLKQYYRWNHLDFPDIPLHRRKRELFELFFELYKPNVIVITADTLQYMIYSAKVFSKVSTIQIDEACQLPECTLISLLRLFPSANYGLIGDIKQLPPYCEDELKGKLKEYGIGNTMEMAIEGKMFPEAILRYVYRCHPKITELLSELFYDGNLISGVKEDQRNEFMRKRSDIWPNHKYPMIVVNNREKGYKIGTSCANKGEKLLVKQIVKSLLEEKNGYKLLPSDIGVISFYSGQTAVLTEVFRGTGVKCGTVDAFQGSEREVIVLCCTNEKISEFMQLSNRLNVAMSRARQATIIIGHLSGLSKAKYWSRIVQKADENGCIADTTKYPFYVSLEKVAEENKKIKRIEVEKLAEEDDQKLELKKVTLKTGTSEKVNVTGSKFANPESTLQNKPRGRTNRNRRGGTKTDENKIVLEKKIEKPAKKEEAVKKNDTKDPKHPKVQSAKQANGVNTNGNVNGQTDRKEIVQEKKNGKPLKKEVSEPAVTDNKKKTVNKYRRCYGKKPNNENKMPALEKQMNNLNISVK